jgi:membrane protein implicated in regulation of membrane protease activity
MPWGAWLVLGFVLLAGEMLTPGGFYLAFFAVGALAVGVLGLVGVPLAPWGQWLLFTVLSIGLILALRSRLVGLLRTPSGGVQDSLVGEWATATAPIAAGGRGQGELRGAAWSLQNAGDIALAPGDRCRVERVDGLTLLVRK